MTIKKDQAEKIKRVHAKFSRQAKLGLFPDSDADFIPDLDIFTEFTEFSKSVPRIARKTFSLLEDIVLACITLSGCDNPTSAFTCLTALVKQLVGNSDEALCHTVMTTIFGSCRMNSVCDYFQNEAYQGTEIPNLHPDSGGKLKFVNSWLGNMFDGLNVVKNSELIHKIVRLISILIAAGFVGQSKKLSLSYAGLQMFSIAAAKEAVTGSTAFDLIEAALTVGHLFISKLYVCFEKRSLRPMFLSNYGGDQYYDDLTTVFALADDQIMGVSVNRWPNSGSFIAELESLISATNRLIAMSKDVEKRVLKDFLTKLKKYLARAEEAHGAGELRQAPFAFLVHGPSSAGKTSITAQLVDFSLKRIAYENGNLEFVTNPNMISMLNETDEYDSSYQSYTLAVWEDDMGNASFEKSKAIPTNNAIRYINNAPAKAVKAELAQKDRVNLEPLVYAATTNVPTLWASVYSNAKESALRRYQLHIDVQVKPEWVAKLALAGKNKDKNVVRLNHQQLAKLAAEGDYHPDAWNFRVTEWIPVASEGFGKGSNRITGQEEPIEIVQHYFSKIHDKEILCEDIGMPELLELFAVRIGEHLVTQKSVVASNKGLYAEKLCPHGEYCKFCAQCCAINGLPIPKTVLLADSSWSDAESRLTKSERQFAKDYKILQTLRRNPVFFALTFIPERIVTHPFLVATAAANWYPQTLLVFLKVFIAVFTSFWTYALVWNIHVRFAFYATITMLATLSILLSRIYRTALKRVSSNRLVMRNVVAGTSSVAAGWGRYFLLGTSAAITTLSLLKLWRAVRKSRPEIMIPIGSPRSYFAPSPPNDFVYVQEGQFADSDIKFVNSEVEDNPWLHVEPKSFSDTLPVTSQYSDLSVKVTHAQIVVRFLKRSGQTSWCNGFIVNSGELLVPGHEAHNFDEEGTCLQLNNFPDTSMSGINHRTNPITKHDYVHVGELGTDTDLIMIKVPSLGKRKDLRPFFSDVHESRPMLTTMFFRDTDFKLYELPSKIHTFKPCVTQGDTKFTYGAWCNRKTPGKRGMCMSTHVYVHNSSSFILGFHLASDRVEGGESVAQVVTRSELYAASEALVSPANPRITSLGPIPTNMYGIDFTPVHKEGSKTVNGYQKRCQADYYGTIPNGRVRPKSSVIESPIAAAVTKATGQEQEWGPPANCRKDPKTGKKSVPEWAPYSAYLEGAGNARQEFSTKILQKAVNDYHKSIDNLMKDPDALKDASKLCPLNDIEIISGQDGVKFVDAMKPSTSMGFPLKGPKSAYLTDLLPEEHPNHNNPRAIAQMVLDQAEFDRSEYLAGRSCNPIFKCCTKDEPTKLNKDKVRVFEAAPVHAQVNIRKYFLPIAAYMSAHPIEFECAVGINSQGPQWDRLMKHLTQHGKDRLVAGDFKAYDLHMSGRMINVALNIMVDMAEKYMDYSADDITIMRAMASDIAYPLASINGDLTMLFGSNPSGQNLTVFVNSLVNSLYQRSVFFEIYPDFKGAFASVVALTTYGDDNAMGVHESVPEYNHTNMQKIYAKHDIIFTMAQKDDVSRPFINISELEYLKRWSTYHPELQSPISSQPGMYVAKLDNGSIFKSLMSNLKSKTASSSEVAVQCLDSALREWFFHGPLEFEKRHAEMKQVVAESGYTDWVPASFWHSYERREVDWRAKYGITTLPEFAPPIVEGPKQEFA